MYGWVGRSSRSSLNPFIIDGTDLSMAAQYRNESTFFIQTLTQVYGVGFQMNMALFLSSSILCFDCIEWPINYIYI